ncbi:hypothetical protein [Mycoplasmopsis verecunda]|uniref:Uncharacterized protein n=1 Tax=Mycoplasmopsis verecunda TaxID=171291 RepID=A0A1T4L3N6_9BACT|nr:hypothetical protein [Mycoplasmopsis verecunda]WPB54441.1 hypothetical protein SAM46_03065 [Mycoplasmopsis verecunda]SJZ49352.1 hypothetical protein SAMN02745154_00315 [Mycoplasmopsis verecunda]
MKSWNIKFYWIPYYSLFASGFFLVSLCVTYYVNKYYHSSLSNTLFYLFLVLVVLPLIIFIINWLANYKDIFKIDNIEYKFNNRESMLMHPFYRPLRYIVNLYLLMGSLNPVQNCFEVEEYDLTRWNNVSEQQLNDYLDYKDFKNCKKLTCFAYMIAFPSGIGMSILFSLMIPVWVFNFEKTTGPWVFLPVALVCFISLIYTLSLYFYMSSLMYEITLNRIPDVDHNTKLAYFESAYWWNQSLNVYNRTVKKQEFIDFIIIRNRKIRLQNHIITDK